MGLVYTDMVSVCCRNSVRYLYDSRGVSVKLIWKEYVRSEYFRDKGRYEWHIHPVLSIILVVASITIGVLIVLC